MVPPPAHAHLETTRLATFLKKRKGASKSLNWPYDASSTLSPEWMSSAGFYHIPTNAKPLLTRCYLCKVEIEEWEEGDNPIAKHLVASRLVELPNQPEGSECALAVVKSQSWETDGARLGDTWDWGEGGINWPRGERMENARKGTFAVGWPVMEDGVPSIDEIAAAGWYFRPGATEDDHDQCICPCCTRAVSGWEVGDDPIENHQKKLGLTCAFFLSPDPSLTLPPKSRTKAPASSKSAPASTASRGKKSTAPNSVASTVRAGRSRGKVVVKEIEQEEEEEEGEVEDEVVEEVEEEVTAEVAVVVAAEVSQPPLRASRRKAGAPSSDDDSSKVEAKPVKKSTRATRGKKAVAIEEEEEEEVVVPTAASKRGGRKGRLVVHEDPAVEEEVIIEEEIIVEEELVAEAEVEVEEIKEADVIEDKPAEEDQEEEQEEPVKVIVLKKGKGRTTAKGKGKAKAIVEPEPIPEPEQELELEVEAKVEEEVPTPMEDVASPLEETAIPMEEVPEAIEAAVEAPIPVEVEAPVAEMEQLPAVPAPKKKSKAKAKSKTVSLPPAPSSTLAPILPAVPTITQPLTPIIASPSPSRPIRSIPRKFTSPLQSPALSIPNIAPLFNFPTPVPPQTATDLPPVLTSISGPFPPYTQRSNPFLAAPLPQPNRQELANGVTVEEWYKLCRDRELEMMKREMEKDVQELEERIKSGRERMIGMLSVR